MQPRPEEEAFQHQHRQQSPQQLNEAESLLDEIGLTPNLTWGTSRINSVPADGSAPTASDDDDKSAEMTPSTSQGALPRKMMKAASKSSQFYTTIVVICCGNVKEWAGFVKAYERACCVFKKVECALRDRAAFPLPDNVSLKDLLDNSFFKGAGEEEFVKYCKDEILPLTEEMIAFADRLYANKFTDSLKHIRNHVLPRFLQILKGMTGKTGQKSG